MSMQPQERVAELIDEAYAEMKQRYDASKNAGSRSPVAVDATDELVVVDTTNEFSAFVSWPTPAPPETLTHLRDLAEMGRSADDVAAREAR